MSQQALTLLVGVAGLVVGWITSGYQRITEKLVEERRAAYGDLLETVERLRLGGEVAAGTLEAHAVRAQLVCSPQMEKSGLVPALVDHVGTPDHPEVLRRFLVASRADSTLNSMFLRALMRSRYQAFPGVSSPSGP